MKNPAPNTLNLATIRLSSLAALLAIVLPLLPGCDDYGSSQTCYEPGFTACDSYGCYWVPGYSWDCSGYYAGTTIDLDRAGAVVQVWNAAEVAFLATSIDVDVDLLPTIDDGADAFVWILDDDLGTTMVLDLGNPVAITLESRR